MNPHTFRQRYKSFLLQMVARKAAPPTDRPCIVFAPHQDDETLGCGGLIHLKSQLGAAVWVVYLTDGGRSHVRFKTPEKMRIIRRNEAIAACGVLGVPETQVIFLNFPNGGLQHHLAEAEKCIKQLLNTLEVEEIYLPSALDYHDEHRLTWQLVMGAARQPSKPYKAKLFEYPVWYWYHWPWVPLSASPAVDRTPMAQRLIAHAVGLQTLLRFNHVVNIQGVLEVKRRALFAHASQMTRLNNHPKWLTLLDVANGEFAEQFLCGYEVFHQISYSKFGL